jgi:DNA-directed RNA polymerase specialized sigma24 family protein
VANTSGGSQNTLDEDSALFDIRFQRSSGLLHFIACRILDDPEQAKKAVENCRHSASARAPHFEYEGAFRSWLARVLIDEALLLLREKPQTPETNIALEAASPR